MLYYTVGVDIHDSYMPTFINEVNSYSFLVTTRTDIKNSSIHSNLVYNYNSDLL